MIATKAEKKETLINRIQRTVEEKNQLKFAMNSKRAHIQGARSNKDSNTMNICQHH